MAAEAARRGLNLLLIALPETGLPEAADELSRLYDVESEFWELDLRDRGGIADFVEYVGASRRTVELLINNAGIGGTAPFAEQNPDLLAGYAISRTYRNHRLIVPGLVNRMLRVAGRLTPLRLLTKLVGGRISMKPGAIGTGRTTVAKSPQRRLHRATIGAPERTPA